MLNRLANAAAFIPIGFVRMGIGFALGVQSSTIEMVEDSRHWCGDFVRLGRVARRNQYAPHATRTQPFIGNCKSRQIVVLSRNPTKLTQSASV